MFEDPNPPAPILDHNDPRLTLFRKAKNAAKAAARITRAINNGEKILVGKKEWERRSSICNVCDLWKPGGNLGMGECAHEKCGCTKLKRGLKTERCPLNKWEPTEIS